MKAIGAFELRIIYHKTPSSLRSNIHQTVEKATITINSQKLQWLSIEKDNNVHTYRLNDLLSESDLENITDKSVQLMEYAIQNYKK